MRAAFAKWISQIRENDMDVVLSEHAKLAKLIWISSNRAQTEFPEAANPVGYGDKSCWDLSGLSSFIMYLLKFSAHYSRPNVYVRLCQWAQM